LLEDPRLSTGPREKIEDVPERLDLTDSKAFAPRVFRERHPIWEVNLPLYRERAGIADPLGCSDPDVQSIAHLPLLFEEEAYGTLSIDSKKTLDWKAGGYHAYVRQLARLTTFLVRDVVLYRSVMTANEDRDAIIAYQSDPQTGGWLWEYEVKPKLENVSSHIAILRQYAWRGRVAKEVKDACDSIACLFDELKEIYPRFLARPPACSPSDLLTELQADFKREFAGTVAFDFSRVGIAKRVRIPEFLVRAILSILIRNAAQAAEKAGTPSVPGRVTVQDEEVGNTLRVHVMDDGSKIPDDQRQTLLRPPRGGETPGALFCARGGALFYKGNLELLPSTAGSHFVLTLPLE
jgi:hypothetical protein